MNDKQRAEFESWFFSEIDGGSGTESIAWQAWQAAIASAFVELPKGDGDETGWLVSLTEVEDALDAAGVKYK